MLSRHYVILDSAVKRAAFRSGSSLSAVQCSFHYSHETHPTGSDTHGCLTLHFAKNGNERRAKPLKPTLPTAFFRLISFVLILSVIPLAYGNEERYLSADNTRDKILRVKKIYDGDTIAVVLDGRLEKIRLLGIDAPEMDQNPWGKKAREGLRSLITGSDSKISLEYDIDIRDKYGRILAYVWTSEGSLINEEMLKNGYAVLFTFPPNVKYAGRLHGAQKMARTHKAGIWSERGLKESPSDYRKKHPRK